MYLHKILYSTWMFDVGRLRNINSSHYYVSVWSGIQEMFYKIGFHSLSVWRCQTRNYWECLEYKRLCWNVFIVKANDLIEQSVEEHSINKSEGSAEMG